MLQLIEGHLEICDPGVVHPVFQTLYFFKSKYLYYECLDDLFQAIDIYFCHQKTQAQLS